MPMFLISYDLRKQRNYQPLYETMTEWRAKLVLQSVWLADLKGPAETIVEILMPLVDGDDALLVVELAPGFDWATLRVEPAGQAWLNAHSV